MNIILFDPQPARDNLLPLTYTRPVAELLVGMMTMRRRWEHFIPGDYSYDTVDYLKELFPMSAADDSIRIAGNIVADATLADAVRALAPGQALYAGERLIAVRGSETSRRDYSGDVIAVEHLYDIFMLNGRVIEGDFALATAGRASAPVPDSVTVIGDPSRLFIAPDATVEGAIINVKHGPVYIGDGAEVMEGTSMRGPIAVCDSATVNMGTKIYGATTIGTHSKVGGEINNAVIFPYSNKAHDGVLGNAVIGSWCNLGAGCVASNLKNDYTPIKLWNYPAQRFLPTGLQFCGLIMGDHSKAGINTMFNTATVIGVGVNIHGTGFPRNFVASFSEGGAATGFSDVSMTKFFDIATRVMARRNITLSDADCRLFHAIRLQAENYK